MGVGVAGSAPGHFSGLQRRDRFRVPAAPGRRRTLGARHSGAQHRTQRRRSAIANQARIAAVLLPRSPAVHQPGGTSRRRNRHDRLFQHRVLRRPEAQGSSGGPSSTRTRTRLIAAMNRELEKIPGVIWNFSQPIADNMEEAVSGVKGELATKIYGDDLKVLEEKADQIVNVDAQGQGNRGPRSLSRAGPAQPQLRRWTASRPRAIRSTSRTCRTPSRPPWAATLSRRYCKAKQRYDLVMRYLPQYRNTKEAIENIRLLSPSGERVSLAQLCKIEEQDGGSEIYREGNQRYVAIKYSVRGRDLGGAVEEAMQQSERAGTTAARLSHRLGRRIRKREARPGAAAHHRAADHSGDLHDSVHHVPLVQMGRADSRQRGDGPRRRPAGAAAHGNELQRFFRRRLPGAVRRLGADRRHHARIHQPASRARATRSRSPRSKAPSCGCAPS